MKKTVIASVAFAAALFAVSCQKETNPAQNVSGPMTISAVSEGLNTPTKTELAFKYDVLWSDKDKIYVKDASGNHDTFTLQNGTGTTKGTFKQDGKTTLIGEVQAYYPATMLDGGSPVWPASQTNDQTIPMYCKKTLSGEAEERMDFSSLGSVLQIVFNTTQENVTLKSIEIKDGSATLSGAFTVDTDGKAVITATDKAGITLDLGTGAALGKAANYFNIAVPAGSYQDLTLVFTATDGTKCTMTKGKVNIAYNAVGRLTLMGEKFKADVPDGALPGKFSVSATKKVYFSQGNLYYDGSKFNFEANQYGFNGSSQYQSTYVSHFFWSKDESIACAESYNDPEADDSDVFFTNETVTTAKAGFTVNVNGKEQSGWRTLSTAEWQYLFDTRTVNGGTKEGKSYQRATINSDATSVYGMILYPDNYTSQTDATSYTSKEWTKMEENGCVFLPAAGYRRGSDVHVGFDGDYWSSTAYDGELAYDVYFGSRSVYPVYGGDRNNGYSVRLITDASVTPAPTPTTTGTAKATIGGSQVEVNWVQLWENGPKFAEYNVGASSATDIGSTMTFTDATKAGADYVWGDNWCTPSKADMGHLMTAAKGQTDEKVKCEYTQEGSTYGFKFTGLTDGYTDNSVFFPAQYGESDFGDAGYWSATADGGGTWRMRLCYGDGDWNSDWGSFDQLSDFLVRPVLKN